MTINAIINQDGSLHRVVHSDDIGADHPDDCAGRMVFAVARAPKSDEVPDMVGNDLRGWRVSPAMRAKRQASAVIAKFEGATQRTVYDLKEREARAFVAGVGLLNASLYPFIAAESGATGIEPGQLADAIIRRADEDRAEYHAALAKREAARRRAKVNGNG